MHSMFLRAKTRFKDGKAHRYWSIVETRRVHGKRVVQRQVLYLGEINASQKAAWCKTIDVIREDQGQRVQIALFPEDQGAPALDCEVVRIKLSELQLHHPRQWGACWLACQLWERLSLDEFWMDKLPPSRKGTRWLNVFKTRLGRLVVLQADRACAYQAGINTSSTSSQDLPSAKYRLHSSSRERNASR